MEEWYWLRRGDGLHPIELANMTAEERRWWVEKMKKEQEEMNKTTGRGNLSL